MSEKRWSPTDCLPGSGEEARLLREAFGDPGLQTPQGRGATSDTVSVPACPRCAALEAENERLRTQKEDDLFQPIRDRLEALAEMATEAQSEREAARALLAELAAAVREQQSAENEPTDAPGATTRMMAATVRVADLLRRAEAEAGGAR